MVGSKSKKVLHNMQKAIISGTLNSPSIIKDVIDIRISYMFEKTLKIL